MNNLDIVKNSKIYTAPFVLLLVYLFIDYGRPQDFVPLLTSMHIGKIAIGLLLATLFLNLKSLYFKNIQTKMFFILLLLMTLHVPIARNNYWAYEMWYCMLIFFFVFLAVINFADTPDKIEKFIIIWIMINLICAVNGIKNGGKIPSAIMGDENDFALVMNMAIPFAYFMFLESSSKKRKIFFLTASGIFVAASVISLSRGGFIGLVAAFFYCWYKTPRKIVGIILVSLLIGVIFFTASDEYFNDIKSIKEENVEEGTGATRWYYWKRGWLMYLDHPIIGVGQGNFPWNVHYYEPPDGFQGKFHGSRVAHSLYFTLIPELGLIGIFLFSGMLFYSLRDLRTVTKLNKKQFSHYSLKNKIALSEHLNKMKFIAFGVLGALWTFLVTAIFLSVLYYPHFWLLIALATAIGNVTKKVLKETSPSESYPTTLV